MADPDRQDNDAPGGGEGHLEAFRPGLQHVGGGGMMLLPKNMGMIVPPAQPAAGSGALGSGALGPGLISPNHTMVPFGGLNGEGRSTSAIVYQAYYDRFSAYPPGRFPREECPHVTTRQCPVCSGQVKDVPAKGKEAGRPEIKLPEWGEAVDDSVRNDLTALLIAAHTGGVSAVAGGGKELLAGLARRLAQQAKVEDRPSLWRRLFPPPKPPEPLHPAAADLRKALKGGLITQPFHDQGATLLSAKIASREQALAMANFLVEFVDMAFAAPARLRDGRPKPKAEAH